jgi:agmatine/peptidylarginine deiminase
MRTLRQLLTLSLLTAFAVGCDAPGAPSTDLRGQEEAPPVDDRPGDSSFDGLPEEVPLGARFTPSGAYRLDPALPLPYRRDPIWKPLKADEFDSMRAADPEEYAITEPPARIGTVRPMVEWEPMKALMFAFPGYTLQYGATTKTFVDITVAAVDHGEVWVIVDSSQAESIFKQKLAQAGLSGLRMETRVKFARLPLDSYWLVDFGPLPLIDVPTGTWAVGDFRYYHERPLDDGIPTLFSRAATRFGELDQPTTYRMPLSTEGGTFQSTTEGICFSSSRQIYNMSCEAGNCRESILGLSLSALQTHQYTLEMESNLIRYAGCRDLIILHSITDDGTGHIDMYMKVLDDDRILVGDYRRPHLNDAQAENARLMDDNASFLEAYIRPGGKTFEVLRLPMPGHRLVEDFFSEYEIPFTYLNSTFFNGINLWPAYTFPEWEASRAEAQAIWEQILPDMEHVWIDAEELSYQSGAIHCITRTIPAMPAGKWVDDGVCNDGVCVSERGGYDGVCRLGNASSDLCWGPEWLCGCNDCRDCPESQPNIGCNGVSWRGCCEDGDVLYCENYELKRLPCDGAGCGWDATQGYYNCGLEGADPSGETAEVCVCQPQCDGRTCGADGCGGECGTCGESERCIEGLCRNDCVDCVPGAVFCDGAVSTLCVAGVDGCNGLERVDCAASGLDCEAGDCVEIPEVEPGPETIEPGPEVVEPEPDSPEQDMVEPEDTGMDDDASAEPAKPRSKGGCEAGGIGGLAIGLLGLLPLLRLRRRQV